MKNNKNKNSEKNRKNKIVVDAMRIFSEERKRAANTIQTRDGFDNFISRVGLNNNNALSASTYVFNLVTRVRIKLEAAYRGSWVVGVIIDAIAEDMTRAGIDVTTNEDDSDIKDLKNGMSRLKINQSLSSLIKWGRLYGGAIGVLQIKGQDTSTPLDLDSVGQDQFEGIVVYDRWQLNPQLFDVIDSGPDMGLPSYYDIVTDYNAADSDPKNANSFIRVHHSRVIRYTGIDLPYFQAITEMMWGESVLERLWDRLICFDDATMSTGGLIDRANLRTVGIKNLREALASGGKASEGVFKQFEFMRFAQVNEGLTLLDSEDNFQSTSYSFAGIPETLLQFGQQLAGASGIPLVRLFGQSPAGLNSTGESDLRMYYDNINSQQEAKLRAGWELILKVMWRSIFGKPAPKDLEFTFVPLWQTSSMDKATIASTNTQSVVNALNAGLVSRETGMKELRGMSGNTGLFSNISDEEITEAENEEPPLPEVDPVTGEKATEEKKDKEEPEKKESVKNKDSAHIRIKKWLDKS